MSELTDDPIGRWYDQKRRESEQAAAELRAHIAGCPSCRKSGLCPRGWRLQNALDSASYVGD